MVANDNQKVTKGLSESIKGVIRGYQSSSKKVTDGLSEGTKGAT
jgi:hypothetical protein